jgi:hypothetical protein
MTTQDQLVQERDQAGAEVEVDAERSARAANLFDVRRFIGGLFILYGAILFVLGIGASDADVEKAAGVNVNLWTGLAMLIVGGIFLAWAFTRPLADQLEESEQDSGAGSWSD